MLILLTIKDGNENMFGAFILAQKVRKPNCLMVLRGRRINNMAIWVVRFSKGGYKIRKVFAYESKEIIIFWISGSLRSFQKSQF